MRPIALVVLLALSVPVAVHAQLPNRQGPSRLLADTNGDGQLSLEEYQAARRNFLLRFDTNKDGVISGTEWTAGAKRLRNELASTGVDASDYVGLGIFDLLDTDKNGLVTPAEMDAAAAIRFARADTNHDGFVSMAEAKAFLDSDLPADANGDNKVTEAEYKSWRANFLMRADANKDGVISRTEWPSAVEMVRTAMVQNGFDATDLLASPGIFDILDTDKSGTISRAEIDAASAARFAKMDLNHNGSLTRAEIVTALAGR